MKKTIAIDIRLLGKKRTGDEAVFFNLTKEMLALNKQDDFLLLTNERDPRQQTVLAERLGCVGQTNAHLVPLTGKNRFLWNFLTLPWFLMRNHVDVLHTQYILPSFIPSRTKVALHIHDVSFRAYPQLIGLADRLFLSLLIPRSLRRADRIIAPSQFTKDEVVHWYAVAAEKVVVIPNAISEEFSQVVGTGKEAAVRKKYHLPERFVLYVGTLQPRKNIPFLLRAFALLRQRLPDSGLVLVGNRFGHHVDRDIESVLRELHLEQSVCFPGYIDQEDLPAVIRAAGVFVFPSRYEGFGIPLLEAMSQDVPVAASAIPCLEEVAGEAALYFDPTSIASCEEKLYTLLTDNTLRESGISKGKDRLILYSWKKSAASLLALYESMV